MSRREVWRDARGRVWIDGASVQFWRELIGCKDKWLSTLEAGERLIAELIVYERTLPCSFVEDSGPNLLEEVTRVVESLRPLAGVLRAAPTLEEINSLEADA